MTILENLFSLNLNLDELMLDMRSDILEYDYDCLPTGALPFASMRCDGVHYCVIPQEDDATLENSPIYRISPMDFSNGTVLWVAKNFCDFVSITAVLNDAWALPILVHDNKNKEDFNTCLEDIALEYNEKDAKEKKEIKKELDILTRNFPTIKIKDLYSYINNSYLDIKNHANVKFSETAIKKIELGHYAYVNNW